MSLSLSLRKRSNTKKNSKNTENSKDNTTNYINYNTKPTRNNTNFATEVSKPVLTRQLVEDFTEIPFDLIPNYNERVRRLLSFEMLKENVQKHVYRCFAMFSKVIYFC